MREEQEFDEIRAKGDELKVFRALDLVVDTAQGLAHLYGEPIHLRPRTFQLLEFLIENRHRLVEKNEIFFGCLEGRHSIRCNAGRMHPGDSKGTE
ncbi:MAG: hypothetical protein FJW38_04085 [Acidobacteria bacterium]|nr:hypothetical protein [Acidobacteriota bacterium]